MTHRSRTHRLALLCVSTALATGALLTSPAGPAAAAVDAYAAPQYLAAVTAAAAAAPTPAPPSTPTPVPTESARDSVKTTDPPTGITAELAGPAKVRTGSLPLDGKPVKTRVYLAEVPAGASGFSVYDMPGDRYPLDEQLQGFVDAFSLVGLGTVTSHDVRKSTVDGRPVLDARLSGKNGDESTVGFIRLISDDDHLVLAMTLGLEADKKELNGMHQQLIDSLKIP
ncbi:hypothetical protein ACFYNM_21380 [Streptomyces spororaveus]|uniref:hypothetical protein n=1 Tax=Streptomyces spororaveus TaxID=284039 RepID=UPI003674BE9D